jgi:hypothetical protein
VLPTAARKGVDRCFDVVILMLDHESGLLQTVKDISPTDLRANMTALAKLGTLLNIP